MRVLLIDDHPVMLHGLHAICAAAADLTVVGMAATETAATEAHHDLDPDVVVLPIRLGGTRRGIEICRWIKQRAPTRVVFFTAFARPVDAVLAMLAGADALVPRTAPPDELIAAIHPTGTDSRDDQSPSGILTAREQDVLHQVLEGRTNPEIADTLHLGLPTVKTHMRNILRKLDVSDRRELL
ncbi:MAG: response regulator transcription factor [Propionibacteriaceae bacterium]